MRERSRVFGEVAGVYEQVRAGYPVAVADAVLAYAGVTPAYVVDVGAGTGKATDVFRARGIPVRGVEPDPAMAEVLRRRHPDVRVAVCRFEDWVAPAGGVPVLACAQAWHWIDPGRRLRLAHQALSPGGVLALFGHEYRFADRPVEDAVHAAYGVHAPLLLDDPAAGPKTLYRLADELSGTPLFTGVQAVRFDRVEAYPTERYLRLLQTFSNHRMLEPARRTRLHEAIAAAVDAHGGVVRQHLRTLLVLARPVPAPEC